MYSKKELVDLIKNTQEEVQKLLKSEDEMDKNEVKNLSPDANGGRMIKDEAPPDKDKPSDSAPKDDSSPSPAPDTSSAPTPSAPPPDASPPPAPSGDPSAGGPPASGDPSAAGSAGADPVSTLIQAYSQLDPATLKAHFDALRQVITSQMAAPQTGNPGAPAAPPMDPMASGGDPSMSGGMPPAGPGASAPAPGEASKPLDPGMAMKNEKELLARLSKSEKDGEELKKSIDRIAEGFSLLMRKPNRVAIRGKDVANLNKSEDAIDVTRLNPNALRAQLAKVAKNPTLAKSDRDLINGFFNQKVKVAELQVLFDKK